LRVGCQFSYLCRSARRSSFAAVLCQFRDCSLHVAFFQFLFSRGNHCNGSFFPSDALLIRRFWRRSRKFQWTIDFPSNVLCGGKLLGVACSCRLGVPAIYHSPFPCLPLFFVALLPSHSNVAPLENVVLAFPNLFNSFLCSNTCELSRRRRCFYCFCV